MNTSSQRRTAIAEAEKVNDDYVEREEGALRRQLGLRPWIYDEEVLHPDQRPCPSWCYVGQSEGYSHEISETNPAVAVHTQGFHPTVMASCYPGWRGERPGHVHAATIEPYLEQRGQSAPLIKVYLRHGDRSQGPLHFSYTKRLELRIADARDLVVALQHLIDTAAEPD